MNTSSYNSSINKSVYTNTSPSFDWRDIILMLSFSVILIIGVIGNALVCYCFRENKRKKLATMENLIYWLAIVDLSASIINPTLYIYWQATFTSKWDFGVVACKIIPTLAKASVSISIGIILIITIDRCIIIVCTFKPAIKQKHVSLAVIFVVILSVLCEVPHMIYLKPVEKYSCLVYDAGEPGFVYPVIAIYLVRDLFFLVIFILTFVLIYNELYNKEHIATLKQQKDLGKTKEIVVMMFTMAIVFIILVFPRDILHLAYMMSWLSPPGIPYTKTLRDINAALKILHMCNSVCNVFIYAGLHSRFRSKLVKLIKDIFCSMRRSKYSIRNSESETTIENSNDAQPMLTHSHIARGIVRHSNDAQPMINYWTDTRPIVEYSNDTQHIVNQHSNDAQPIVPYPNDTRPIVQHPNDTRPMVQYSNDTRPMVQYWNDTRHITQLSICLEKLNDLKETKM